MIIPQIFPLSGMTCTHCTSKITQRLLEHPEIASAEVVLDPPEARVMANQAFSDESIDEWLRPLGKYHVFRKQSASKKSSLEAPFRSDSLEKIKIYYPLILLAVYLVLSALAGTAAYASFQWETVMRLFMGGFFVAFSFFKLLNLRDFAAAYRDYDLVTKRIPAYGYIYPFIELFLGLAYLANWQPFWINLIAVFVMAISLVGVLLAVISKQRIKCACLGTLFNLPMSTVTVVEDLIMLTMAVNALLKF